MSQPPDESKDPLVHLEEELSALLPTAPSVGLQDRIFSSLAAPLVTAEPALEPPSRSWFGWVPLAAAAAVALLAVVFSPPPQGQNTLAATTGGDSVSPAPAAASANSGASIPVSWKPVSADSRLEHVGYEGVRMEDRATYRQIRTRSLERRTFVDPADGTVVEVVFPSENIHLVPVVPE